MGCIASGMVQMSPENTNKVQPIPLKTDKVTKARAKEERKSALAKHRSITYHKAKSLSDRVLAEKETLSTSSTVRSSWSRSTAPTQIDSLYSQNTRDRGKCVTNKTDVSSKSVHFENQHAEIRSDSGHFSDIPGLTEECETKHDNVIVIANNRTSESDELKNNTRDDENANVHKKNVSTHLTKERIEEVQQELERTSDHTPDDGDPLLNDSKQVVDG
ncbi:uncharacterized protein [Amphiura filiformis]|uniref:uncharacterized protein n=1 Tax=Amphiura filiformis TaxID=82378 RepID=UPI003B21D4A2